MAILQMAEYKDGAGKTHVQFDELVGTGLNWIAPARVLGMDATSYIMMLKDKYDAELTIYKDGDKVRFIGYRWNSLTKARAFKSLVNRVAREKQFTMEVLYAN